MKLVVFCIVLVAIVFFFRDDIVGTVVGDLKHIPPAVAKYNTQVFGIDYFQAHGREALEIQGICGQNSGWRREEMTRIFAQNCINAESIK
ncbi:MAG: hypothetical protein LBP40_06170 [Campylobacteraceae bacterium]|jgi:hypothetical protein|nr:hypothetical protein [Campylobacteraceae bacterium]